MCRGRVRSRAAASGSLRGLDLAALDPAAGAGRFGHQSSSVFTSSLRHSGHGDTEAG
jgi:hypothetical protein